MTPRDSMQIVAAALRWSTAYERRRAGSTELAASVRQQLPSSRGGVSAKRAFVIFHTKELQCSVSMTPLQ